MKVWNLCRSTVLVFLLLGMVVIGLVLPSMAQDKDVVDTAIAAGSFNTLVAAVKITGLVEDLKGKGPFTVFAPTDGAFGNLAPAMLEALLKPENKGTLKRLLSYHVVPGKISAKDAVEMKSAKTLNGQTLNIDTVKDGTVRVEGVKVVKKDIMCANGVIHIIEAVVPHKATHTERRALLKSMLSNNRTLVTPGCYDTISARLIEKAGFPVIYLGSYATSASRFGLGDIGLVTMTEMVQTAKTIVDSTRLVPIIGDAENGFNNAANIWRTVEEFEKAGVSGIHIEDHEVGKHTNVPPVILPLDQMVQKVRAAVDAREDPNFIIIARTDVPWALKDLAETVRRANAFTDAGADMVAFAGLSSDKLRAIRDQIRGKVLTGNTPGFSVGDEERAHPNVVLYFAFGPYSAYQGVKTALARFKETKDINKLGDLLVNPAEFDNLVGYADFEAKAKKYFK